MLKRFPVRLPLVLLSLALPLALACATPLPERAPADVGPLELRGGERRATDHVLVVTDASGSMYARETFPEAKAVTRSFVRAMPSRDAPARHPDVYQAGLVGFGGEERTTAPLASFDRSRLAQTAADLRILGDVDGMGGDTPLDDVLDEAGEALEGRRGRAAIVLVSDGLPDSEKRTLASARSLVEEYPDQICLYAVHVGGSEEGRAFLNRLADTMTCGAVSDAGSVSSASGVTRLARTVFAEAAPRRAPPPEPAPEECQVTIRLRGVTFAFDRAEVRPDAAPVLNEAARQLKECPRVDATIVGHTDAIGSESYNQALGLRRARAVRSFLVDAGVEAGRLGVRSAGESDPVAPNDTSEGRQLNRRVELETR